MVAQAWNYLVAIILKVFTCTTTKFFFTFSTDLKYIHFHYVILRMISWVMTHISYSSIFSPILKIPSKLAKLQRQRCFSADNFNLTRKIVKIIQLKNSWKCNSFALFDVWHLQFDEKICENSLVKQKVVKEIWTHE